MKEKIIGILRENQEAVCNGCLAVNINGAADEIMQLMCDREAFQLKNTLTALLPVNWPITIRAVVEHTLDEEGYTTEQIQKSIDKL